jgi:colanic acid biosynthesis glycosyl transferase WcaI
MKQGEISSDYATGLSQACPKGQRLWIVSELYSPELTSTGYFLTGIAEGLAQIYDVSVLCGQPSYWARGVRAPTRETLNGVDVQRCWGTTLDKNRILFKTVNMVTISLSIFLSALFYFRRGDVVIVVTNPPILPYLASVASYVRGSRFILLVHDVYPEILIRLGVLKPQSMPVRLLDLMSRWLYNRADRVLVLGRDMQDLVCQKLSSRQDRVVVATNWANTETISPQLRSKNKLLSTLNLGEKFVVQFWGNMGRPHCLEDLLDTAQLLALDPDFHFLLIGWGTRKPWVIAEKQARGLENMTILDPFPREDSCDVQNACDIAINTLASGMTGISVPSRSYNAMAAGKPMLAVCDLGSELALMVREENIGWVVPPGCPGLIASALREAKTNQSGLRLMAEHARDVVDSKYTLDHVLRIYRNMIQDLLSQ